jgi:hypothetical protein
MPKAAVTALVLTLLASAADKQPEAVTQSNENLELQASAHIGRQPVAAVLGVDPGLDLVAVQVDFKPKGDSAFAASRDDFTLISRKDGQKMQALHPSQIAGSAALVVNSTGPGSGGGGMVGNRRGPIWGGVPGTGDRPRRIGGEEEGVVGSPTPGQTQTTVENKRETGNPVLDALKQKELPLVKTSEPKAGLLYFILEGKHKLKDLELIYKGPAGTMILDFQK